MKRFSFTSTGLQPILTIVATFGVHIPLYSCVLTLINDTDAKIFVVDSNAKKAMEIMKGKSKKFGEAHTKARFSVFTKEKKHANMFDLRFVCQQIACAGDNKPEVKISDLENKTEITKLFSIQDMKQGENQGMDENQGMQSE